MICFYCLEKYDQIRELSVGTDAHKHIIMYTFPEFETYRELLPGGVCGGCRTKISKNPSSLKHQDYRALIREMCQLSKSRLEKCQCTYCTKFRGYIGKAKVVSSSPSVAPVAPASPKPWHCNTCYQQVDYSPDRHERICGGIRARRETILETWSDEELSRLAADILKKLAPKVPGPVQLKTGGTPLPVHVGKIQQAKPQPLPVETFHQIQAQNPSISNTALIGVAKNIRQQAGRKSIEPGLAQSVIDRPKRLEPFFEKKLDTYEFEGEEVERWGIFLTDFPGFIAFTFGERGIKKEKCLFRIGWDGGQGFFKVTMNIIVTDCGSPSTPVTPPSKRFTYSKEVKSAKDSGESKILLIACVPHIKECYANVKKIMERLYFSSIPREHEVMHVSYLKMVAILTGQQSAASAFPCPYCTWRNGELGKKELGKEADKLKVFPRTVGVQKALAAAYQNPANTKSPMFFYSTPNEILLAGDPDEPVLNLSPPPQLHIFMGLVTKILRAMDAKWGNTHQVYQFLDSQCIKRSGPNVFDYEGPKCNAIISEKVLGALKAHVRWCAPVCLIYVKALEDFAKVKTACFGHYLDPNLRQIIHNFEMTMRKAGINPTLKAHILFDHVATFCERVGKGLAIYAEHATETAHSKFAAIEQRYPSPTHSTDFGDQLKASVLKYNINHV